MITDDTPETKVQTAIDAFYERRIPTNVGLVVCGVVGLSGNLIVLMVLWRQKTLDITKIIIYLITVLDLANAGILIPMYIIYNMAWFEIMNEPYCKIIAATTVLVHFPGLFLVLGLSIFRYYKLSKFHKPNLKIYFVCVFILTFLLTFLTTITSGRQTWSEGDQDLPGYYCFTNDDYRESFIINFLVYSSCGLLLLCFICVCVLNAINMKKIQNSRLIYAESRRTSVGYVARKPHEPAAGLRSTRDTAEESDCDAVEVFNDENKKKSMKQEGETMRGLVIETSSPQTSRNESGKHSPFDSTRKSSTRKTSTKDDEENVLVNNVTNDASIVNIKEVPKYNIDNTNTVDKVETTRVGTKNSSRKRPFLIRYRITFKVFVMSFVYLLSLLQFFVVCIYINFGERKNRSTQHNLFKYVILPAMNVVLFRCAFNPLIYYSLDHVFRMQCRELYMSSCT